MNLSIRCLLDYHDWTTEAVVIRGQSWSDGRERCRRCATPKPDASRRTFIFGAVAVAAVAAMGPLEIITPVAPRLGLFPSGALGVQLEDVLRRAFVPRLITQMYQTTPLLARLTDDAAAFGGGPRIIMPITSGASA